MQLNRKHSNECLWVNHKHSTVFSWDHFEIFSVVCKSWTECFGQLWPMSHPFCSFQVELLFVKCNPIQCWQLMTGFTNLSRLIGLLTDSLGAQLCGKWMDFWWASLGGHLQSALNSSSIKSDWQSTHSPSSPLCCEKRLTPLFLKLGPNKVLD